MIIKTLIGAAIGFLMVAAPFATPVAFASIFSIPSPGSMLKSGLTGIPPQLMSITSEAYKAQTSLLKKQISQLKTQLKRALALQKSAFEKQIDLTKSSVKKQIDLTKSSTEKQIDLTKSSVKKQFDLTKSSTQKQLELTKSSAQKQFDLINSQQMHQIALQKSVASKIWNVGKLQLRIGSRGRSVSVLQQLLASDPSIYPQGLITGYYGRLTEDAVKKFQHDNGIESVGNVGPQTRSVLNAYLARATSTIPAHFLRKFETEHAAGTTKYPFRTIRYVPMCGSSSYGESKTVTVPSSAVFTHVKAGYAIGTCGEIGHGQPLPGIQPLPPAQQKPPCGLDSPINRAVTGYVAEQSNCNPPQDLLPPTQDGPPFVPMCSPTGSASVINASGVTTSVSASEVPLYVKAGYRTGTCPEQKLMTPIVQMCRNNNTIGVPSPAMTVYEGAGFSEGVCQRPIQQIPIETGPVYQPTSTYKLMCWSADGNTSVVSQSNVGSYEEAGWSLGACSEPSSSSQQGLSK